MHASMYIRGSNNETNHTDNAALYVCVPLFLSASKTKQNQNQIAKFIAFVDKSIISMHIAKLYLYTFSVSIVWIVCLVCCVHMCARTSLRLSMFLCGVQNINLQL